MSDQTGPSVSTPPSERPASLDALTPPEIAAKATDIGVSKESMPALRTFCLAVLAGAFIALGAMFATTVIAGAEGELPFGVARLLAGLAFCLGLILVVVGGAELFTGNNLIAIAWAERRVPTTWPARNWAIVYAGNLVGALLTVAIVYVGQQYELGDGAVGSSALAIAQAKSSLGFAPAIALGIMCNALVCLAIWMTRNLLSSRSIPGSLPVRTFRLRTAARASKGICTSNGRESMEENPAVPAPNDTGGLPWRINLRSRS